MGQTKILSGNEIIVEAGLKAGFDLFTGYPGSPLADYFNILNAKKEYLKKLGVRVSIGNSEANAAAMASGAKQAGKNVMVAMKSMGLHVASDALSVGNFADPGPRILNEKGESESPGVVIVVGDDPWSQSTSTAADSRYLFKHLHIPFLEPSNPQELYDYIDHALTLSRRSSLYTGILLTTFMAEGGGLITCGEHKTRSNEKIHFDPSEFNLTKNVMVPPNSLKADQSMIQERFPRITDVLEEFNLDRIEGDLSSPIGIISSGVIFETVKEVLQLEFPQASFSLYKTASSYPLLEKSLSKWARDRKHIIVIEEKRGFLEQELKALLIEHASKIMGKNLVLNGETFDGFNAHGGLDYQMIKEKLSIVFKVECQVATSRLSEKIGTVMRLPTFCPGCPHRETLSVLKEVRETLKSEGINLITHGDVGCYSLSFLPPFKEMHNLSAMGQGGALGAGLDIFSTNPSVVLMGDSTFFHSGLTDISNSVQLGHQITYILLDNDNTAMTGHQMSPASGVSVEGSVRPRQHMSEVAKSLGASSVIEISPSDRYFYKNLLLDFVKKPGVKVIVSDKECSLTFQARKREEERIEIEKTGEVTQKRFFQINTDVCEDCRVCVEKTGCPGLSQIEDAYGPKVFIDPNICVSDGYCTYMKACPSFEEVVVSHYRPLKNNSSQILLSDKGLLIKEGYHTKVENIKNGKEIFRVVLTGVGGSGITTISKLVALSSNNLSHEGLSFKFMDQKGLAQRNGRVTGHMAIHKIGEACSSITPHLHAQLILSPDLLDAVSALDFLSPTGHLIVDEEFQMPLGLMLDHHSLPRESLAQEVIEKLKSQLRDRVSIVPAKKKCVEVLGSNIFAPSFILGAAYQLDLLPFSLESIVESFQYAIKRKDQVENNIVAFNLGRTHVQFKEEQITTVVSDNENIFQKSLMDSFLPWQKSKYIMRSFSRHSERLMQYFPEINKSHILQYLHDIYVYDRGANSEEFMRLSGELNVLCQDKAIRSKALAILLRSFFVKDEVMVAHQLVSPLKKMRDQARYGKVGKSFKVRHINRPSFEIFGIKIEIDLNPPVWSLKTFRHLRFMRFFLGVHHRKEREENTVLRKELMELVNKGDREKLSDFLKKAKMVKGYREVRTKNIKENLTQISGEVK